MCMQTMQHTMSICGVWTLCGGRAGAQGTATEGREIHHDMSAHVRDTGMQQHSSKLPLKE